MHAKIWTPEDPRALGHIAPDGTFLDPSLELWCVVFFSYDVNTFAKWIWITVFKLRFAIKF